MADRDRLSGAPPQAEAASGQQQQQHDREEGVVVTPKMAPGSERGPGEGDHGVGGGEGAARAVGSDDDHCSRALAPAAVEKREAPTCAEEATEKRSRKRRRREAAAAAAATHLQRALTSLQSTAMRSANGNVELLAQVTRAQDALASLVKASVEAPKAEPDRTGSDARPEAIGNPS